MPVRVTITSTTSMAVIYYTLDGTNPNLSSPKYDSPLNVEKTTAIRAMAQAPGSLPSMINSQSYVIGSDAGMSD